MVSTKTSDGFSTYVSFILIISNLLRLFWWYCERFSPIILVASIVMISCQLILLYYWVKLKNQNAQRPHSTVSADSMLISTVSYQQVPGKKQDLNDSGLLQLARNQVAEDVIRNQSVHLGSTMGAETDRFVESFWYWNKFSNYLICLLVFVCSVSILTTIFNDQAVYHMLLGSASSGIEVSTHPFCLTTSSGLPRHPSTLAQLLTKTYTRPFNRHDRDVALR